MNINQTATLWSNYPFSRISFFITSFFYPMILLKASEAPMVRIYSSTMLLLGFDDCKTIIFSLSSLIVAFSPSASLWLFFSLFYLSSYLYCLSEFSAGESWCLFRESMSFPFCLLCFNCFSITFLQWIISSSFSLHYWLNLSDFSIDYFSIVYRLLIFIFITCSLSSKDWVSIMCNFSAFFSFVAISFISLDNYLFWFSSFLIYRTLAFSFFWVSSITILCRLSIAYILFF